MEYNRIFKIYETVTRNYQYRKGISIFEAALHKDKFLQSNEEFLLKLGLLYDHLAIYSKSKQIRLKSEKRALCLYKKVLIINQDSIGATWGIGRILWHRGDKKSVFLRKKGLSFSKKTQ